MTSSLERAFLHQWLARYPDLPPVTQHVLPAWREWALEQKRRGLRKRAVAMRADFAWPEAQLALELQGGTWRRGGHSTGAGIDRDATKLLLAQTDDWSLLQLTTSMLRDSETIWLPKLAGLICRRRLLLRHLQGVPA